ncbi:hypothetical protein Poly59_57310 [Rubripirellula reticaptiva]|uniref:Uncharacterized protein n=1 Tax=Rubripirellula reticaptiva TaxID=2528013 RepID=A0A5C6ECX0_9BACT|nr:hypothetical protein Poly59_57310 [Rubripirellula reticaptiva]
MLRKVLHRQHANSQQTAAATLIRSSKAARSRWLFSRPVQSAGSIGDLLDITHCPSFVEELLRRCIQPEVREPAFARIGLNPVVLHLNGKFGCIRTKIDVYGPVSVRPQLLVARVEVRVLLRGNDKPARVLSIKCYCPKLFCRSIRRDAKTVGLCTFEYVAVPVTLGA